MASKNSGACVCWVAHFNVQGRQCHLASEKHNFLFLLLLNDTPKIANSTVSNAFIVEI